MKWIGIGLVSAAVLSAALYVYVSMGKKGAEAGPVAASRVGPAAPKPAADALPPAGVPGGITADSAPVWMKDAVPHSLPVKPGSETVISQEKSARMDAALKRLQQLQSEGVTDPKQVSEALLQVEQANGSSVMQGVRLDVLRQNLLVAEKMRVLAEDLMDLEKSPQPSAPADASALRQKIEQFEALRKQLRTDIMQPIPVDEAPK